MYDGNEDDRLTNMFNDVEDRYVDRPDELLKMLEEAEKTIYPSVKIIKLSFLIRLYNLKLEMGGVTMDLLNCFHS